MPLERESSCHVCSSLREAKRRSNPGPRHGAAPLDRHAAKRRLAMTKIVFRSPPSPDTSVIVMQPRTLGMVAAAFGLALTFSPAVHAQTATTLEQAEWPA